MKVGRIIGLGLVIWTLSLIWPELNDWLTQALILKLIVGLGTGLLVFDLLEYFGQPHDHHGSTHPHDSTPIPRGSA